MATTLEIATKNHLDRLMAAPFTETFGQAGPKTSQLVDYSGAVDERPTDEAYRLVNILLTGMSTSEVLDTMAGSRDIEKNDLCILVEGMHSAARSLAREDLGVADWKATCIDGHRHHPEPMAVNWGLVRAYLENKSPEGDRPRGSVDDIGFGVPPVTTQHTPAWGESQEA